MGCIQVPICIMSKEIEQCEPCQVMDRQGSLIRTMHVGRSHVVSAVPVDMAPAWRSGLSVKKICRHGTTQITCCRLKHYHIM